MACKQSKTSQKKCENSCRCNRLPLIRILSLTSTTCGDVYSPVRKPLWRRIDSTIVHVEPLPLVPATWITDSLETSNSSLWCQELVRCFCSRATLRARRVKERYLEVIMHRLDRICLESLPMPLRDQRLQRLQRIIPTYLLIFVLSPTPKPLHSHPMGLQTSVAPPRDVPTTTPRGPHRGPSALSK